MFMVRRVSHHAGLNVGDALTSLSLSLHVTDGSRTDNNTTAACMRTVCVIGIYDVGVLLCHVMLWMMYLE